MEPDCGQRARGDFQFQDPLSDEPDALALTYPSLDEFKLCGTFSLQRQHVAVGVLKLEPAAQPLHW